MDENAVKSRQILHNLTDYDFDILGHYRLDKVEAEKIIDVLKAFLELKNGKENMKCIQ